MAKRTEPPRPPLLAIGCKVPPEVVSKLDARAARNLRNRSLEMRAIIEAALAEVSP